jgi:hypothetical protein
MIETTNVVVANTVGSAAVKVTVPVYVPAAGFWPVGTQI